MIRHQPFKSTTVMDFKARLHHDRSFFGEERDRAFLKSATVVDLVVGTKVAIDDEPTETPSIVPAANRN
ncbi:hypothetical protein [Pantanalinema sp. GBBB05]|uniref:hypothetical protein n=1 Tax=Pantanalinema sp. GBBB05 TaxID=2604139 RepID=UPI003D815267